jgi:hypothetical protein
MIDGEETQRTDGGNGQGRILDAWEKGRASEGQILDGKTTERDRPKGREGAVGFVYFIETDDGAFVKIGYSQRVHARLSDIGTLRPSTFAFRILGSTPAGPQVERWLHRLFGKDCDNGEWFRSTPRLRALIDTLQLTPAAEIRRPKRRSQRRDTRSLIVHVDQSEEHVDPEPELEPESESDVKFEGAVRCQRCGNEWIPRVSGRPKQCPSCHQAKWDVPAWTGRPAGRPRGKKKAA